jgi:hypothetical protein
MTLPYNTIKLINTAIDKFLKEKNEQLNMYNLDPDNFIPKAPTLVRTLSMKEIQYAEQKFRRIKHKIIIVRIPYGNYCKIYYYKHREGNFVIVLNNNNDEVISVSE